MANTLITSSMIAKESLAILKNNLVFARGATRKFEKEWDTDRKIGDTVSIKIPARYTVRSGANISVQNHVQESVPVTLDQQKGVDVSFSSKELALSLEDFSKEVLQPQIAQLANQIDFDGLALYKKIANAVGTPATIPNAMRTYALAGAKMDDEATPVDDDRSLVINSLAQVEIIDAVKGLFQSSNQIKQQYERGQMGTAAGFDWSMSQNVPVHTVGALGGTPLLNGVPASGATSLVTDGWTAAAAPRLKEGDVFTVAGVFACNPLSKQSTGQLRQFVVTSDVSSDGSGNATVGIYPAMITTGAKQNCVALPADNAAITVLGAANASSPTHLAYHKNAFALVTAELPLPNGMDMASRASSKDVGLSIRFIRGYDISTDQFISRLDVLYGWKAIRPEFACRVQG
jgi:hypothetical protein